MCIRDRVQLIPRLYDATEGSVKVGGHDVREYDLQSLRDAVGMILQKNVLFSGTVRENLQWGNPCLLYTSTIIYQKVGKTTLLLDTLEVGDALLDFIGPLGKASELEGHKKVAVVGGGAGCAIAYPQAKALHNMGVQVDVIAGFRNKNLIILEDEMRGVSDHLYLMTDDGSNGHKGFVTAALEENIKNGAGYDFVVAIGPLPMMRAVCNLTKEHNIETMISMNPIMIDGTGMCGGCRLTVGGETKFACVDGPDVYKRQALQ